MNEDYKGHSIHATCWRLPDTDSWTPRLIVLWTEEGREMIQHPRMTGAFPTEQEAERQGIIFAKNWIDAGKPGLESLDEQPNPFSSTIISDM